MHRRQYPCAFAPLCPCVISRTRLAVSSEYYFIGFESKRNKPNGLKPINNSYSAEPSDCGGWLFSRREGKGAEPHVVLNHKAASKCKFDLYCRLRKS
jgi:hypothetical protein